MVGPAAHCGICGSAGRSVTVDITVATGTAVRMVLTTGGGVGKLPAPPQPPLENLRAVSAPDSIHKIRVTDPPRLTTQSARLGSVARRQHDGRSLP